jgi:L-threonylcarbamoyladenylate synthase
MIVLKNFTDEKVKEITKSGGVGVIPTDTLYGIIGSAFLEVAVERIYALKKRDSSKPLIVLISDFKDLEKFEIKPDSKTEKILKSAWPGPVSVILPILSSAFRYLTRGGDSIAFRLPNNKELREFLKDVGPIVAPSANPEGLKPAENIEAIKNYFGNAVDFIIDGGVVHGEPSSLLEIKDGKVNVLRGSPIFEK